MAKEYEKTIGDYEYLVKTARLEETLPLSLRLIKIMAPVFVAGDDDDSGRGDVITEAIRLISEKDLKDFQSCMSKVTSFRKSGEEEWTPLHAVINKHFQGGRNYFSWLIFAMKSNFENFLDVEL